MSKERWDAELEGQRRIEQIRLCILGDTKLKTVLKGINEHRKEKNRASITVRQLTLHIADLLTLHVAVLLDEPLDE